MNLFRIAARVALFFKSSKINKRNLSLIDSEYKEDSSLKSAVSNLSSDLRSCGLKFSTDPIDIDTQYKSELLNGKHVLRCYLTLRLPRDLKNNPDLYDTYLGLRRAIWDILHDRCVSHERLPGLKIYRENLLGEHDHDDLHGYYYKLVISYHPLEGLDFIQDFFRT